MLNIYSTGLLCIRLAARQSGLSAAASLPRSERFGQIGVHVLPQFRALGVNYSASLRIRSAPAVPTQRGTCLDLLDAQETSVRAYYVRIYP